MEEAVPPVEEAAPDAEAVRAASVEEAVPPEASTQEQGVVAVPGGSVLDFQAH